MQSVLEDTTRVLHHEQRLVQELQAQLPRGEEERDAGAADERGVQDATIRNGEVGKARAALHREKEEFDDRSETMNDGCTARECETKLLGALLSHATMQLTARERLLFKLRTGS